VTRYRKGFFVRKGRPLQQRILSPAGMGPRTDLTQAVISEYSMGDSMATESLSSSRKTCDSPSGKARCDRASCLGTAPEGGEGTDMEQGKREEIREGGEIQSAES